MLSLHLLIIFSIEREGGNFLGWFEFDSITVGFVVLAFDFEFTVGGRVGPRPMWPKQRF